VPQARAAAARKRVSPVASASRLRVKSGREI
jgi:hypothetical protein